MEGAAHGLRRHLCSDKAAMGFEQLETVNLSTLLTGAYFRRKIGSV